MVRVKGVKIMDSLSVKMFGKRWRDLTDEEKKEHNRAKCNRNYHKNPKRQQEYNKRYLKKIEEIDKCLKENYGK